MAQQVIPLYQQVPGLKAGCNKKESIPVKGEVADVTVPTLTIFEPEKKNTKKTAVLIFPGGGYSHLAMEKEGYELARKFNALGVTAFVLKYRMPLESCFENRRFVPLQDAQKAMSIIRKNALSYQIDPDNVGILGFSAGGHLAATLLTLSDTSLVPDNDLSLLPSWGVLGYPVIDMSYTYSHTGSRNNLLGKNALQEEIDYFSAQKQVKPSTPPTFIFLAQDDKTVNPMNSLLFYQAMLKNKVKGEIHVMQNGGHGFGLHNTTTKEDWFMLLTYWLQQNHWID